MEGKSINKQLMMREQNWYKSLQVYDSMTIFGRLKKKKKKMWVYLNSYEPKLECGMQLVEF